MSVAPALTSPELTALAGPHTLKRYLSVVADTVVATAQVNGTPASYPLVSLAVNNTSANWLNVRAGQTVYIGSTAGAKDRGIYRIRKATDASNIYIAEIGAGDPGLLPMDIRTGSISNSDYITVIERYDIWSVLPRINYPTDNTIYEDYDLTVGNYNTTPPPIVNVTINNQAGGFYANYISGASQSITAIASALTWPGSGSIASYAWTVPAAWTGVSGAATATLTASAPPGNYVLYLTVTDSNGMTTAKICVVNIHSAASNPPILIADQPTSDTRNRTGRRMSFALNSNNLASIPDGTMCCYFEVPIWNGTDVPTATRKCVGWLTRQTRRVEPGLRSAEVELIGPAFILGMLGSTSQIDTASATADTWQKVVTGLSFGTFLVWYVMQWRAANVLKLFNFTPFSVAASGQQLPSWRINQSTLLGQIQDMANSLAANFGSDSSGELFLAQQPSLVAYTSRSGIIQRDSITTAMFANAEITRQMQRRVRKVRGEALTWDGVSTTATPLLADAPQVYGQGQGDAKLASQVVANQATLNQRTGDEEARQNNPYTDVQIRGMRNRDVYEPAQMYFIQVTIPANLSADGVQFSKRCVLISVSKRHNADGTADIDLSSEAETTGVSAVTVPVPPPSDSIQNGGLPPGARSNPNPIRGGGWGKASSVSPANVQWIICTADGYVARYTGSAYSNIGPNSSLRAQLGTVVKAIANPYNYKQVILLGTNAIAYCDDITKSTPIWMQANVSTVTPAGTWSQAFDFTVGDQGFSPASVFSGTPGSYSPGNGWTNGDFSNPANNNYRGVYISRPVASSTITGISFIYDLTVGGGTDYVNPNDALEIGYLGNKLLFITCGSMVSGNNQSASWAGLVSGSSSVYISCFSSYNVGSATYAGAVKIKLLTMMGTGSNPFGGGGGGVGVGIGDIQGSVNKKGWFCWLTKITVSSVDYVYFNWTTDFFRTSKATQIAKYVATCTYSIAVSGYGTGKVVVTAGDPAGADAKVYTSSDWGKTFSASANTVTSRGGAVNIPYTLAGGGANAGGTYVYVKGLSTNLDFLALNSTVNTVVAGTSIYPQTGQALNSYTLDGNYLLLAGFGGQFYSSSNGGVAWTAKTSIPGTSPTVYGINGWPTNRQFVIAFGANVLAYSTDGGTTWTNNWTGYNTFKATGFNGGGGTIVTALPDLGGYYSRAVTT